MLEINLLPVREARRKADLRDYLMSFVLVLIVTGGGIGLFHSRLVEKVTQTEARVRQMQSDIDKFEPQLKQVAAFKKRKADLQAKIDVIVGLDRARSGPVRMLDELAIHTPDRLWLTNLETQGDTITLQGKSLDNELVAMFLRNLGESEYFDSVDLDSAKLGSDRGGLKLVKFKIIAKLVQPKEASDAAAKAEG